jgi:hypothetical protein
MIIRFDGKPTPCFGFRYGTQRAIEITTDSIPNGQKVIKIEPVDAINRDPPSYSCTFPIEKAKEVADALLTLAQSG